MKKNNDGLFNFPSTKGAKKERVSFEKGGLIGKIAKKIKKTKEDVRELIQDKRHRAGEKKAEKEYIKKIGTRAKDFVPLGQTDEVPERKKRGSKMADSGPMPRPPEKTKKKKKSKKKSVIKKGSVWDKYDKPKGYIEG